MTPHPAQPAPDPADLRAANASAVARGHEQVERMRRFLAACPAVVPGAYRAGAAEDDPNGWKNEKEVRVN